jgi:hypothetical protein
MRSRYQGTRLRTAHITSGTASVLSEQLSVSPSAQKLALPATERERKQALAYLLNVQLMILQSMAIEEHD